MDSSLVERLRFAEDWLAASEPRAEVMDVRARMAMYRALVADDEQSPFWGYASQLAWQHRSGRLGRGYAIEPTSWWGACNYALSVVPYVAAMQLGRVPQLTIELSPSYAGVLPAWRAALQLAVGTEAMRVAIWRAHLASITRAVRTHERELAALPAAEQRFARGWVRMVDLFAAAALPTDLRALVEGGDGALPSRILHDDTLDDLPRPERGAIRRVGALADRPLWRWRIDLAVWQLSTVTQRGRERALARLTRR